MSRSTNNYSNSYLLVNNPAQLQALSQFTISFWLKKESNVDRDGYLFDLGHKKYIYFDQSNRIFVKVAKEFGATSGFFSLSTSSDFVELNNWVHLSFVYDRNSSTEGQLFITKNNDWSSEGTYSTFAGEPTSDAGENLFILNSKTGGEAFPGSIAEIGFWNRVLTSTELENLGLKRYSPSLIGNGLIGHWSLSGLNPEIDSKNGNNAVPTPSDDDVLITDEVPLISTSYPDEPSAHILYAPSLTSPLGGETFNKGSILINWDIKNPPSDDSSISLNDITYEIEYTENYRGRDTDWHTIRRRIDGNNSSYSWYVGKMLKSENLRIRIRSFCEKLNITSEYSPSSTDFSCNVFKLIPPAVLSPVSGKSYTDYIMFLFDETQTINTYNQKIRYKIEYQSNDAEVDWTTAFKDVPVGSTPIRWNIDSLDAADDYQIKITVSDPQGDQLTAVYMRDIQIKHPGLFLIDTKPPEGVLKFDGDYSLSNSLEQTLSIYAEDATTDIKSMKLREIDAGQLLTIGPVEDDNFIFDPLQSSTTCVEFKDENDDDISEVGYLPKISWKLKDQSGLRRLEAKLYDYGNNDSCQEKNQLFLEFWNSTEKINDIIIFKEDRDYISVSGNSVTTQAKTLNVAYVGTESGKIYRLEPYPTLIYDIGIKINKLLRPESIMYIFAYNSVTDIGYIYRDDKLDTPTALTSFTDKLSEIMAVAEYSGDIYIGFKNGQLWKFDGTSFSKIHTFSNPINSMRGDERYLYVGFYSGTNMYLYNGTSFISVNIEV